jgi:hypothetical protein
MIHAVAFYSPSATSLAAASLASAALLYLPNIKRMQFVIHNSRGLSWKKYF